ncbi:MAG: hypothetical protein Q9200_002458 [Gallowayella weberi]
MDVQLRVLLAQPTTRATINDFLQYVRAAKSNWFDLYKPYGNVTFVSTPGRQFNNKYNKSDKPIKQEKKETIVTKQFQRNKPDPRGNPRYQSKTWQNKSNKSYDYKGKGKQAYHVDQDDEENHTITSVTRLSPNQFKTDSELRKQLSFLTVVESTHSRCASTKYIFEYSYRLFKNGNKGRKGRGISPNHLLDQNQLLQRLRRLAITITEYRSSKYRRNMRRFYEIALMEIYGVIVADPTAYDDDDDVHESLGDLNKLVGDAETPSQRDWRETCSR